MGNHQGMGMLSPKPLAKGSGAGDPPDHVPQQDLWGWVWCPCIPPCIPGNAASRREAIQPSFPDLNTDTAMAIVSICLYILMIAIGIAVAVLLAIR